ncbi:hypothetical protein BH10PSE3_BH10PSE3_37710 [soil metagenome]
MPVYVRFVCFQTIDGQRSRLGVFQAIDLARDSDQSEDWALAAINDLRQWFNTKLTVPPALAKGRGDTRALSWFKPEAVEHVRQMYLLKTALEACGVHVEVLTTKSPGNIAYEDDHQITAVPYGRSF